VYKRQNIYIAIIVITALYAIKSVTIVFPLAVLNMSVGLIYPAPLSILINLIGLLVCATTPYLLGKLFGTEYIDKLVKRYPKIQRIKEFQNQDTIILSFFVKTIAIIPSDVGSLFFGAMGSSYFKYLLGSMLSMIPHMIAVTYLGETITKPFSIGFMISSGCTLILTIISIALYYFLMKKHVENIADHKEV
jgi:uncharacterized membrane protein YdjX (TVP38/TMEM64 family)